MITHWRIEMLGGLRVYLCGPSQNSLPTTRFSTAKMAALLAYLALHGRQRSHPREELIDLFWPDADAASGRVSLRTALSSLRRQLEPPGTPQGTLLFADRHTVSLNPAAFSTDVGDFETALKQNDGHKCHSLYRGELLPGLYDEWVITCRDRLTLQWETQAAPPSLPLPPELPSAEISAEVTVDMVPKNDITRPRLPLSFTACFGREADIAHLRSLLTGTDTAPPRRFLTLTGPGGTGKTRLALEVARSLSSDFEGAVFFAPLADLHEPNQIAEHIALHALGLPPTAAGKVSEEKPLDAVVAALSGYRQSLLVLDNMEHLVEAGGAALSLSLIRRVPTLSILVTSRRRLSIADEREYPVSPLSLPDTAAAEITPEMLVQSAAVRLFIDRAQVARPDFQVTPHNARFIAALCQRLDGLPLALELVAARSQSLTPAQMLSGLDDLWEIAATRRPDKSHRHRSLHNAIAWSVDFLPPDLSRFWASLSVFRGGFSGDAAAVVTGDSHALERLTQLRERSLLAAENAPDEETIRFRLLETLREFAHEKLDETHGCHLSAAHSRYFADWAEKAQPHLQQSAAGSWLDKIETERPNLLAALAASRDARKANPGDANSIQTGLRLGAALWRFWELRGYFFEGRAWLDTVLADDAGGGTSERAKALNGAGMLAARQGDYADARARHEECLALYRLLDYPPGIATALGNLGLVAMEQNHYEEARPLYEESLAVRRVLGDTYGIALMLNNLGNLADEQGDQDIAGACLAESLKLRREMKDPGGIAQALGNLGNSFFRRGDAQQAQLLHEEGLAILRGLGDKRSIAYALLNLGEMASVQGQTGAARQRLHECLPLLHELGDRWAMAYALDSVAGFAATRKAGQVIAARLHGAAAALREKTGSTIPPVQRGAYDDTLTALQNSLGKAAFARAFQGGVCLSEKDAVRQAL